MGVEGYVTVDEDSCRGGAGHERDRVEGESAAIEGEGAGGVDLERVDVQGAAVECDWAGELRGDGAGAGGVGEIGIGSVGGIVINDE